MRTLPQTDALLIRQLKDKIKKILLTKTNHFVLVNLLVNNQNLA